MAATLSAPAPAMVAPPVRPSAERGRRKALRLSSLVAWSVTAAGVALLAFVGFLVGGSSIQAGRTQDVMYGQIKRELADATVPVSGLIEPGTPIGVLDVPRLRLQQVLLQGSSSDVTTKGPGLKSDTAFPGQAGLSLVVGRRATFGAPFRHLDRLAVGDRIYVTTGLGRSVFRIDLVRHTDDPASTIPSVPSRLTLVTSDPAMAPTRQVVVSAALEGTASPASTTPQVREGEAPGQHTLDQGVIALLWTQALLVVVWAATRAGLRFRTRTVWVGAVPVLLAIAWHLFESVAVLLPNTL